MNLQYILYTVEFYAGCCNCWLVAAVGIPEVEKRLSFLFDLALEEESIATKTLLTRKIKGIGC